MYVVRDNLGVGYTCNKTNNAMGSLGFFHARIFFVKCLKGKGKLGISRAGQQGVFVFIWTSKSTCGALQ